MAPKKTNKVPVTHLRPPKEVRTVSIEYDPETQVRDAFEDDLEFLLNDNISTKPQKPNYITQHSKLPKTPVPKQKTDPIQETPQITKKLRKQLMSFDMSFDVSSGSDEETTPKSQFMERQLQLEISRLPPDIYDEEGYLSTDIESIGDYSQLLGPEDGAEDDNKVVVSDEEEQIQLDEEFNGLTTKLDNLSLDKGIKGQKKKLKSILDEATGMNWTKLKQRMDDEKAGNGEKQEKKEKKEKKMKNKPRAKPKDKDVKHDDPLVQAEIIRTPEAQDPRSKGGPKNPRKPNKKKQKEELPESDPPATIGMSNLKPDHAGIPDSGATAKEKPKKPRKRTAKHPTRIQEPIS